jgi:hypothetical protein
VQQWTQIHTLTILSCCFLHFDPNHHGHISVGSQPPDYQDGTFYDNEAASCPGWPWPEHECETKVGVHTVGAGYLTSELGNRTIAWLEDLDAEAKVGVGLLVCRLDQIHIRYTLFTDLYLATTLRTRRLRTKADGRGSFTLRRTHRTAPLQRQHGTRTHAQVEIVRMQR